MIELVVVLLGFFCPEPDLPTDAQVSSVLQTGWPSDTVYGSSPYEFPTSASDGGLTYKVAVDPLYEDYANCFSAQVRSILSDGQSWGDGVNEAGIGETPNVWIVLAAPGGTCATPERPKVSCARHDGEGEGEIVINAVRWFEGSGNSSLAVEQPHLINHEVGHLLGLGHQPCGSVMAPYYQVPDDCSLLAWPSTDDFRSREGATDTKGRHIQTERVR